MSQRTIIRFKQNVIETCDKHIKQFLKNSERQCEFVFLEEQLVTVVHIEEDEEITLNDVRMMAGNVSRALQNNKIAKAVIDEKELIDAFSLLNRERVITAFVEGWKLGSYRFMTYKSDDKYVKPELHIESVSNIEALIQQGELRAEAVNVSRDLMNEAPQDLTPKTFPEKIKKLFHNTAVNVTVFDEDKIKEMEMNGILAVNRGSKHKPAFVELRYEGDATKPLTALVGKGVTFDTGGISLKSGRNLSDMRMDMGGAAAVVGAMKLLAQSEASVNVIALIQIVENMPDNKSLLPGEVIKYKTGQTVQVGNTDAEGRLILADGLIRAGELNAKYIVNIATLTGAIHAALGSKLGGVFGDETLTFEMKKIGDENGDFVWPMPLVNDYDSYLKSDYADFSNISNKSEAGAITAALFLKKFVPSGAKWLHVDMAGVMESKEEGYYGNSATGYGVRLLADYTKHISK